MRGKYAFSLFDLNSPPSVSFQPVFTDMTTRLSRVRGGRAQLMSAGLAQLSSAQLEAKVPKAKVLKLQIPN